MTLELFRGAAKGAGLGAGCGVLGLDGFFPHCIRLEPGAPGSGREAHMGHKGLKSKVLWLELGSQELLLPGNLVDSRLDPGGPVSVQCCPIPTATRAVGEIMVPQSP